MEPLLRLDSIYGGYGDVSVLNGLSYHVNSGETVVIVGPNGAGKSTSMKAILSFLTIFSGEIFFDGVDITRTKPDRIIGLGVGYVPQVDNVFKNMTVQENLEMGGYLLKKRSLKEELDHIYSLFPPLLEKRHAHAGHLSGGQRQMVAMGKALMASPKLLLLDEPTAGLSPKYMEEIFTIIKNIKKEGTSILMVEQNARQALAIADRGYVLVGGAVRTEGAGVELAKRQDISEMFLGG